MLNFILYNDLFIKLLCVLIYFNIILTNSADDSIIKDIENYSQKNNIEKFKEKIIKLYTWIFSIVLVIGFIKFKNIYAFIVITSSIVLTYKVYINITQKSMNLSINDKKMYIYSTAIILFFISSNASSTYIKIFNFLSHPIKEILLIIYLILKIIIYLFFILINISIIISNIKIIYKKRLAKIISIMGKIENKKIELKLYDFHLYKKYNNNFALTIDKIIYIISLPIYILIVAILYLLVNIFRTLLKTILKILSILSNFDNNRDNIIKHILQIALIISLILVYGISIYNKQIFSNEIIEIYNLITTVVLIPVIYDGIKNKNKFNSL